MYNKIVAFSIGEMLNNDTAIIHYEKSDPTIRGLYQAINHEFVVHAWSHTTYINGRKTWACRDCASPKNRIIRCGILKNLKLP